MPVIAVRTAVSMSASGKTMFALLPPSSSVRRFIVCAAATAIFLPTLVEPVNAILSTPGWATSAAPVSPLPVTTLKTPGGRPASRQRAPRRSAVIGVCSAGFMTTVQPAASADAAFHAAIIRGKFQGRICAATPTGSRRT